MDNKRLSVCILVNSVLQYKSNLKVVPQGKPLAPMDNKRLSVCILVNSVLQYKSNLKVVPQGKPLVSRLTQTTRN